MNPFSLDFMRTALAASVFAGTALSLIGIFVLARRQVFSGLAVSQLAALGTVVGILAGFHHGTLGVALLFVAGGLWASSRLGQRRETPSEAWVGALYVLGAGVSILILSKAPHGESHTMDVFFGNILTLGKWEVLESLFVLALTAVSLLLWFPRWVWVSFDPISAEVAGLNVNRWNALFLIIFAVSMTISIHIFGVLLAFAYLVLPAAAGLTATRRISSLLVFVPLLAVSVTIIGFYFSFRFDFPTGPFVATLLVLLAFVTRVFRRFL